MRPQATADSWKIKPMPAARKVLAVDGRYTATEVGQIAHGYIPADQQDKWFIYFAAGWLHFHRSWTGTCIFQLSLTAVDDHFSAQELIVNQDPEQYKMNDDQYNLSLVAYLVDNLLLGRFAQMPLPGKMSPQDEQRHRQHVMGRRPGQGGSIRLTLLSEN